MRSIEVPLKQFFAQAKLVSDVLEIGDYKWTLTIYPNGAGNADGKFISVLLALKDVMLKYHVSQAPEKSKNFAFKIELLAKTPVFNGGDFEVQLQQILSLYVKNPYFARKCQAKEKMFCYVDNTFVESKFYQIDKIDVKHTI